MKLSDDSINHATTIRVNNNINFYNPFL